MQFQLDPYILIDLILFPTDAAEIIVALNKVIGIFVFILNWFYKLSLYLTFYLIMLFGYPVYLHFL